MEIKKFEYRQKHAATNSLVDPIDLTLQVVAPTQ